MSGAKSDGCNSLILVRATTPSLVKSTSFVSITSKTYNGAKSSSNKDLCGPPQLLEDKGLRSTPLTHKVGSHTLAEGAHIQFLSV
jgi:hypothetical protein